MLNYTSIVVGTDGTNSSLLAVRHAAALARTFDAKLTVVTAFRREAGNLRESPGRNPETLPYVPESAANDYLERAKGVADEEQVKDLVTLAQVGEPVEVLLQAAKDSGAEVIVSGNKGVRSLSGRVFGNIPTEIVRKSEVQVLLVNTSEVENLTT